MKFVVGFIGAGKVGISLGKYFSNKGIKVSGYYSKSSDSSLEAAEFTGTTSYSEISKFISNCNLIIITTPDDVVIEIWNVLKKHNLKDKIICHTSGSLCSNIFSNIHTSGAFGYSIHPMFAFSDKFTTYKKLQNAYFSIEGDEKYLFALKSMLMSLGNKVILLDKSKKPLYHLANVTVSNLVLSLLDLGCSYLEKCGVEHSDAITALLPLISNNIENIITKDFTNSLTGPVERGDLGTIKHHLEVIPYEDLDMYKTLSLNLVKLSEKKHTNRDYEPLKKLLEVTLPTEKYDKVIKTRTNLLKKGW